ncbi:MAG: histidine--tRNA ligase [Candidatus Omnitrophica bacterium]|nr:histidine--tRNA ligase [Candidatus Omnitrophota bacterium]
MDKKFAVPRGTSDILPDRVLLWERLETAARRVLKSYGCREIRTPMYEETALFKRSLGQTSDIVNKQLLALAAAKEEGYALRPEGTAAVVRSYLENSFDKNELLSKFFYIGPMFRGERPQKGRLRQFHQIGVEAIGIDGASAFLDAEILALAMHLLEEFGVQGPKLKINSLGSREDKEHISAWLRAELGKYKSDLCENCRSRFEGNVFRVLDCKNEFCKKVVRAVMGGQKGLPLSESSLDYFKSVQNTLENLKINFEVSPYLVRGLDYYTHTVFEITAQGLGSQDAVGAGGRYDRLVHDLGGDGKTKFGGIGFALGIERIFLAAGDTAAPVQSLDVFVVATQAQDAFGLAQQLRRAGISADMGFSAASFKSQMNRANKLNARFALILGEEELKNKSAAVKNMQTSVQEIVALENIIEYLRKALS